MNDLGFFAPIGPAEIAREVQQQEEQEQQNQQEIEPYSAADAALDSDYEIDNTVSVSTSITIADIGANAHNPVSRMAQQLWLTPFIADENQSTKKKKLTKKERVRLNKNKRPSFSLDVVQDFWVKIAHPQSGLRTVALLDINKYLEEYLWPAFDESSPPIHILSIAAMLNEKCRENISTKWQTVTTEPEKFSALFKAVLKLALEKQNSEDIFTKKTSLVFLINTFQSLENPIVRVQVLKLVGISIWHSLRDAEKLELEFSKSISLRKVWNKAERKRASAFDEDVFNEQFFLSSFIKQYYAILYLIPATPTSEDRLNIEFCERFVEFMIDLLSQLPTRRYLTVLLKDHHFLLISQQSNLFKRGSLFLEKYKKAGYGAAGSGTIFAQLISIYEFYEDFEINDTTGASVTRNDATIQHYENLQSLQKLCFTKYRDTLGDFSLMPVGVVDDAKIFKKIFLDADNAILEELCLDLGIRVERITFEEDSPAQGEKYGKEFLVDALCRIYCKKARQLDLVNSISVYPNENDIFDSLRSPNSFKYQNTHCLPIPKLNLQFLTILEAAYEIRQDVEDAVRRLAPKYTPDVDSLSGSTVFTGWARMAAPIDRFEISEVGTPVLGETKPSFVMGEVSFTIGRYNEAIRREWEAIKRHDVLFLITVEMSAEIPSWPAGDKIISAKDSTNSVFDIPFRKRFGIKYIRGCMVVDILNNDGNERNQENRKGQKRIYSRTLRVSMDSNQYAQDIARVASKKSPDLHSTFNIILRRKGSENNFKSTIEAIRDIMQSSEIVVPDWLQDVILGYGDPSSAAFTNMKEPVLRIDFRDTFLDWEHLRESFSSVNLKLVNGPVQKPPFVLTFPEDIFSTFGKDDTETGKRKHDSNTAEKNVVVNVGTYKPLNMGPFLQDTPKLNAIRFTAKQVEAIHAGTSPGLTLVVGPPGTGKTDLTVQIIANIYHNFPQEKTLLITHSNQALNQLFEKIVQLDIDSRHILRLGHGMDDLESEESWGKYGRVNSFLERRIVLLARVDSLATSLGISGAYGYTCETAENFYNQHIKRLWDHYTEILEGRDLKLQAIADNFPFHYYFINAPSPLFYTSQTVQNALEVVHGCFRHIQKIFTELAEIRAFELLRNSHDRSNFLLIKEAKIVALTCTHAALKRRELVALGFKYHNVIMEEAGQILEVEAFIPLLLQSADEETGLSRLKRVVMIGDHHQLPPIVQNSAFQKYGNMEQSLFARLIRLGVPVVELDRQGRCRSGIADLFRWNYTDLQDLDVQVSGLQFDLANPGFAFDYQFVDVLDYNNKGETEPIPHFLQNLGEAEYVVATYQYMRLLGYPANKISIITTYNGQKALIEDVLEKRCRWNPIFGLPQHVATVDKFQGQQNDYVLLSLVRTKTVGHLRDVRRLIVALSRARLGLYVFGRRGLFENCLESEPAFSKLLQRPTDGLWLRGNELWGNNQFIRKADDTGVISEDGVWSVKNGADRVFEIQGVVHMGSYVHQMILEQVEYMKNQKANLENSENSNEDVMLEEIDTIEETQKKEETDE
ncbi:hypothetical protein HK100_001918 [Physocladia obscura]|uniref:Pre-mRNA-splicing factor n=1 Tax=Physocladia obscura TaxID=109957 RepID=A0AAD5XGA0_9FUNG|nr:hypothetical protein HK100_001918 [Physocladia obscura]